MSTEHTSSLCSDVPKDLSAEHCDDVTRGMDGIAGANEVDGWNRISYAKADGPSSDKPWRSPAEHTLGLDSDAPKDLLAEYCANAYSIDRAIKVDGLSASPSVDWWSSLDRGNRSGRCKLDIGKAQSLDKVHQDEDCLEASKVKEHDVKRLEARLVEQNICGDVRRNNCGDEAQQETRLLGSRDG